MYDIIIIGAGPAGLSAAIYARRALKKVLVIEALSYGGQIINALKIDNYPSMPHVSGIDFATNLYKQAKELDCDFVFEKVEKIELGEDNKKIITLNNSYEAKAVIIATGCRNRKLNLENEEKFVGRGISYCATCDGNFYRNQDVAVVGGGNTALEDALYLSDIARKVYIIHRRDEFRASEVDIIQVKEKANIEFIYNSNVIKLIGEDNLKEIEVSNQDREVRNIPISGLFIAIGREPANEEFKKLVELDDDGYIIADEDCHTSCEGIFVAGDNRTKGLRQLVTATSDGAVAATEAVKYIK